MEFLEGLLGGLKNGFNTLTQAPQGDGGGILGLDKNTSGMLGMALMNAGGGGGMLSPLLMMKMFGMGGDPQGNPNGEPLPNYLSGDPSSRKGFDGGITYSGALSSGALSADKQQMLSQLKSAAAAAYPNNPMMQQVAITQAIHESGLMGRPSQLATKHNNYFGIKAPGSAGSVNMGTSEFVNGGYQKQNARFGRNANVSDSFMQHRNLITNAGRYKSVLGASNPHEAFMALQRAGYATDPNYARSLNRVYQQHVAPMY